MTQTYDSAKSRFQAAENEWDRQIRRTHGKPWYLLKDTKLMEGEEGTPLRKAYDAFTAASEEWVRIANRPIDLWAESRRIA